MGRCTADPLTPRLACDSSFCSLIRLERPRPTLPCRARSIGNPPTTRRRVVGGRQGDKWRSNSDRTTHVPERRVRSLLGLRSKRTTERNKKQEKNRSRMIPVLSRAAGGRACGGRSRRRPPERWGPVFAARGHPQTCWLAQIQRRRASARSEPFCTKSREEAARAGGSFTVGTRTGFHLSHSWKRASVLVGRRGRGRASNSRSPTTTRGRK